MYSPNKSKNMTNDKNRNDINNIYSFNRIGVTDTVEGGASMTIGTEYKKTKKNYSDFIDFNIATIIRAQQNEDLSSISTIGDTHSNFFVPTWLYEKRIMILRLRKVSSIY